MSKPAHNVGFNRTIDTVELSDAFRRHAHFGRPDLVKEMVKQARYFAAATTWYNRHETWFHKRVIENTVKSITRMAEIAEKLEVTHVTLPVTADRRLTFITFFENKIKPAIAHLPVKFSLQTSEYDKDLTHLGRIDHRYKTAIDEGLRGMADISRDVKNKWDMQGPRR